MAIKLYVLSILNVLIDGIPLDRKMFQLENIRGILAAFEA